MFVTVRNLIVSVILSGANFIKLKNSLSFNKEIHLQYEKIFLDFCDSNFAAMLIAGNFLMVQLLFVVLFSVSIAYEA